MKLPFRKAIIFIPGLFVILAGMVSCSSDSKEYMVVIGDQNASGEGSWVSHLGAMMPGDRILNFSVPGNTYGFDNLDNEKLNTVHNIDIYLDNALDSVDGRKIDYLFISLGTNDCKRAFDDKLSEVPGHLRELIRKINGFPGFKNRPPHIVVLSPLPFGPDSLLPARFRGAGERVKYLLPYFRDITHENRCGYIDVYHTMNNDFMTYSNDGIHLNSKDTRPLPGKSLNTSLRIHDLQRQAVHNHPFPVPAHTPVIKK